MSKKPRKKQISRSKLWASLATPRVGDLCLDYDKGNQLVKGFKSTADLVLCRIWKWALLKQLGSISIMTLLQKV